MQADEGKRSMKGLRMLAAVALGIALLAGAAPASAKQGAAFKHYVACGLSKHAKPAHVCQPGRDKGAFFRSNKGDVFYTVCVKFPTKKNLCAPKQKAEKGTLYVNKITSNIPGEHKVTWFVNGKRVGLFKFTVPAAGGKSHHGG
jgi:ABC-type sugar transport system substrate-binding protein